MYNICHNNDAITLLRNKLNVDNLIETTEIPKLLDGLFYQTPVPVLT